MAAYLAGLVSLIRAKRARPPAPFRPKHLLPGQNIHADYQAAVQRLRTALGYEVTAQARATGNGVEMTS